MRKTSPGISISGIEKGSISLRDIVTFTVLNNKVEYDVTAYVFDKTPQPLLLGFSDLVRLKFVAEPAKHQVLFNQELVQIMNNAVVCNDDEIISNQSESSVKVSSTPEIYNPRPIGENRNITTSWPMFVGVTTMEKEAFLKALGIPEGIKINDPFFLLDEIDDGMTTMNHGNGSKKFQAKEKQLLEEFESIFQSTFKDTNAKAEGSNSMKPKMRIKLKEEFKDWSKSITRFEKDPIRIEIIEKTVKELLEADIIERSVSNHSYPAFLVPKGKDKYRMVTDYRLLNDHTVSEETDLPTVQEMIQQLGKKKFFSSMDLLNGYFQMEVEESDRHLTAFTVRSGHYQYKRVPFGLKNAPFEFTKFMRYVLHGIEDVLFYMDDVLITSDSLEAHEAKLREVFTRLREQGVTLKKEKCHLFRTGVKFLGYMVTRKGVQMTSERTEAITNMVCPKNVSEARSFVGMANYFRRFIQHFATIVNPIHVYINEKVEWGKDQQTAFELLKEHLTSDPVVAPYVPGAEMRITCDASKVAIGSVLEIAELVQEKKVWHVVEYFSKSLKKAEKNYYVGDLEFLAIVAALKKFRYYLIGKKFTIRTDHAPLSAYNHFTDLSSRLQRQLDVTLEFDFRIEILKGKDNTVADALSRMPTQSRDGAEELSKTPVLAFTASADFTNYLTTEINVQEFRKYYAEDEFCSAMILQLRNAENAVNSNFEFDEPDVEDQRLFEKYTKEYAGSSILRADVQVSNKILYYRGRAVVPKAMFIRVMNVFHDNPFYGGHSGASTVMLKISDIFYWKKMNTQIHAYVKSCLVCQTTMRLNHSKGRLMPLEVPAGRFYELSMDFLSGIHKADEEGHDRILVIIDRFSKYVILIPTKKSLTAEELVYVLFREVFSKFGVPQSIVSDNDVLFDSKIYTEAAKRFGITLKKTTPYHPQADGQAERAIQLVIDMLRKYSDRSRDWCMMLPYLAHVINTTPSRATKLSPFKIAFGYNPRRVTPNTLVKDNDVMWDIAVEAKFIENMVKENLEDARIRMQMNDNNVDLILKKGDFVLVNRAVIYAKGPYMKLMPLYLGPFKVEGVVNKNAYYIQFPGTRRRSNQVNVKDLKLYNRRNVYYARPPVTPLEKALRIGQISQIVGWDDKSFYVKMDTVDPEITVEYPTNNFIVHGSLLKERLGALTQALFNKGVEFQE